MVVPDSPERAQAVLSKVLGLCPVASVLLRSAPDCTVDDQRLRSLISLAQSTGAAALLTETPKQSLILGADGIHLPWSSDIVERYKLARKTAARDAMIGADAGRARHDAMELGEAGADYVAFGIPAHVQDRARAAERRLDLVAWWSELFEVPCVAFDVATVEEAARLAKAGADFIALTIESSQAPGVAAGRARE